MSRLSRRGVIVGTAAALGGGIAALSLRPTPVEGLSPPEAHARAAAGMLWLIDIRRPDEWRATGIGEGALPIDGRRIDFEDVLQAVVAGAPPRPVALICARGVRSARASARMAGAGLARVLDVPEGMLGSWAGPGWIARGLPVVRVPAGGEADVRRP